MESHDEIMSLDLEDDFDDEIPEESDQPKKWRFDWILPVFLKPGEIFHTIAKNKKAVWLLPMLSISLLLAVQALVASPFRVTEIQMTQTLPADFESYSADMQASILQSQQKAVGTTATLIFPAIGLLAGLWIGWLVLGSLLHLTLTLNGSKGSMGAMLNVVAWASLPLAIRALVQMTFMLITRHVIYGPGLSGLIPPDTGPLNLFFSRILSSIDLFTVWMFVLMVIGVIALTHFSSGKALLLTALSVVILLVLKAIPSLILTSFIPKSGTGSGPV